jgi:hypothetical protein
MAAALLAAEPLPVVAARKVFAVADVFLSRDYNKIPD